MLSNYSSVEAQILSEFENKALRRTLASKRVEVMGKVVPVLN
jgi:hypothetical protein